MVSRAILPNFVPKEARRINEVEVTKATVRAMGAMAGTAGNEEVSESGSHSRFRQGHLKTGWGERFFQT